MRSIWILVLIVALSSIASVASAQTACGGPEICPHGFCVDGFCCDTACDGPCEACSARIKGSGQDGVCGLAAAGTVCEPSSCDATTFAFIPADTCDDSGNCIDGGPPESCFISNGICEKDACHDINGCEIYVMPDGLECAEGMICVDGTCSEGFGGEGGGGGDVGGEGGGGGDSSGTGFGGSGGAVPGGSTDVNEACGCRLVRPSSSHGLLVFFAAFALWCWRRRL